jgi:hypothetical protein
VRDGNKGFLGCLGGMMLSTLFYLSMLRGSLSIKGIFGGFSYLGGLFTTGILFIIYFSERESELCYCYRG